MASRKNEPRGTAASVGEREGDSVEASSVSDSDRERCVQFYVEQLHRYVRRAAACIEDADRDDEFLWHVRRGLECIFAAILEVNGKASTDGSGALSALETLRTSAYKIARVEMLSDANYQILAELLQKNANRGVHAESFQHGSSAARASTPSGRLRSAGFTVARTPFVVLVRWLHAYLRKSTAGIESDLVVIELGQRPQAARRPLRWAPMIAAAMVLGGGALFWQGALVLGRRRASSNPQSAISTTSAVAPVSEERDATVSTAAPGAALVVDAAPSPSCPGGTLLIDVRSLRVNRPRDRAGPPWDGFVDGEITDHRACLANALVTRREYDGCVAEGGCASLDSAVRHNRMCRESSRESPARCVSREQAARYCAWRFPASSGHSAGRVSSVTDWESLRAAAPERGRAIALIPDDEPTERERRQGEWVGDDVPPVLWRGPRATVSEPWQLWRQSGVLDTRAPNAWHSWNARRSEMPAFERIGFRCAVDLDE